MKKKISVLCALTMTCAVLFSGCKVKYEEDEVKTTSSDKEVTVLDTTAETNSGIIRIRYTNSAYTEFLNKCKSEYEQKHAGVEIIIEQAEKENFLVNIRTDSSEGTNVPDLYLIGSDELSTAYLAGLASKVQSETFVSDNYDDVSINACSYNGTLVAYPLSYKTTFLVYNSKYVNNEKTYTLEDIMNYSDEVDFSQSGMTIKKIFGCNISDLFMNYGFMGNGMEIGGKDGCNKEIFSVCNDTTIRAAEEYYKLIQFFSLDGKLKYEDSVSELIAGETVFSIASTDSIPDIEKSEIDFKYCEFPDYSNSIKNSPLSIITAVAVNPYGSKTDSAVMFAEFITDEMSDELMECTGYMSTNKNIYKDGKYEGVYKSYLKSSSKNKLNYGEQVYPLIEIAMHNIAAGEDVEAELKYIDEYMKKQLG